MERFSEINQMGSTVIIRDAGGTESEKLRQYVITEGAMGVMQGWGQEGRNAGSLGSWKR